MKEINLVLKTVAEGLKTLAQGLEAVAAKVGEISPTQRATRPKARPAARAKTAGRAATAKKVKAQKAPATGKPETAIDAVYKVISRSKKGVNPATIKAKTGFDDKKIHNVIYKLKKQGRITTPKKGIYVKV